MAETNGTEGKKSFPAGTIAKLTREILDDTFYNIIHDIVAKAHHDEKTARMRSAVVAARQKAEEEASKVRQETTGKPPTDLDDLKNIRIETEGAVFEDGKAYLKGNPLHTTKDILCPDCRLPRLLYPVAGIGARPPDPYKEYCQRQPPIVKPGYDLHGNPFATDRLNTKKKKQTTTANTPGSSPPTTPDDSFKQAAPEKVSFPTVKCPICPRYLIVTRVSPHLDRCLGLSSRGSNRNKPPLDNNNTPNTAGPKRPLPPGDDEASPVVNKKKKLGAPKKATGQKPPLPSKLKNGTTADMVEAENTTGGNGGDAKH